MGKIIVSILALILTLAAPATAQESDVPAEMQTRVAAAVKGVLKDTDSAQFKGFTVGKHLGRAMDDREAGFYVCGMVNAKNSYGGYVGFAPFAFDTRSGAVTVYRLNGFGSWEGPGNCAYALRLQ